MKKIAAYLLVSLVLFPVLGLCACDKNEKEEVRDGVTMCCRETAPGTTTCHTDLSTKCAPGEIASTIYETEYTKRCTGSDCDGSVTVTTTGRETTVRYYRCEDLLQDGNYAWIYRCVDWSYNHPQCRQGTVACQSCGNTFDSHPPYFKPDSYSNSDCDSGGPRGSQDRAMQSLRKEMYERTLKQEERESLDSLVSALLSLTFEQESAGISCTRPIGRY